MTEPRTATRTSLSSSPTRTRWPLWIAFWLISSALLGMLLANNAKLDTHYWLSTRWALGDGDNYKWEKYRTANAPPPGATPEVLATRPFYMDQTPPMESQFYRKTEWFWQLIKPMGAVWGALAGLVVIGIFFRDRGRAIVAAAAGLAMGNLATAALATVFGRNRPTHFNGTNTWEFFRGVYDLAQLKGIKNLSFPSGHATAAFALAAVVIFFLPKTKWFMIPLAIVCAFSRVVMHAHFYADILAGAVIGWSVSWFVTKFWYEFLKKRPFPPGFEVVAEGNGAKTPPAAPGQPPR